MSLKNQPEKGTSSNLYEGVTEQNDIHSDVVSTVSYPLWEAPIYMLMPNDESFVPCTLIMTGDMAIDRYVHQRGNSCAL